MRIFLFAVLAIVFMTSCQQEAAQQDVLPSGYEYVHHINGGGAKPNTNDMVFFHYQMRSDDSVVVTSRMQAFPQALQLPDTAMAKLQANPVIEALRMMAAGDSLTILVPLDTVPQKPQGFENSSMLYYDIAMQEIKSGETLQADQARVDEMVQATISQYNEGTLENIQTTESGLKYVIHEKGDGVQPQQGQTVFVNYFGALTDGTMFDNSFGRGQPFPFPLGMGQVIPGWDEGIGLLNVGDKATLFVPSTLGYGPTGAPPTIPGDAELVFYVELLGAQ